MKQKHNKKPAAFHQRLLCGMEKTGNLLSRRLQPWQLFLSAFFLPFLILFLIYTFNGVIFGSNMILAHDQWHQYFPFFLDLQQKLHNGGSLFYSWTNGMGTNFLSLFAYYLASPMNFLAGLLPQSLALGFYTFCSMLKISSAGLFFAVFLRKLFDRSDLSVVFFSLMYAFCAFICGYYWNAIWLDTVALLPLVTLGTIRLLKDRKYVLYTAMLALSVFCSYYVGLFTCIFVLLTFICYNICYWDDLGGFGSRLLRIAFFSLLGIGMTAVLTLPAFFGLQATSSADNTFPKEFALNIVSDKSIVGIVDGIRQIISQLGTGILPTSMEGLPNVACGSVTVVLAIAYFCTKNIPLREKLCAAGLLLFFCLSFLIRQLDYIWHGFHFPNMLPYRFSFLFSFVLLFMAYRAFTQIDRWRWYHCLYVAPFAVLFLFCVFSKQTALACILSTLIVLLTMAGLYLFSQKHISKNLFVLLLCSLLVVEAFVGSIRSAQQVGFTNGTSYPLADSDVQQVLDTMHEMQDDSVDLWRAEMALSQTLNDNALNGYNGISTFSSAANAKVSLFLKGIGLPASVAGNRYCYNETTPLNNLLLGLKYLIDRNGLSVERPYFEKVSESGNVKLLRNNAYLPMGIMLNSDVLEYDSTLRINHTRTTNLNYLYQLLSGNRDELLSQFALSEHNADSGIEISGSGSQFNLRKTEDASGNGKAYFTYHITEDCHFCVYTSASDLNTLSVSVNDTYLTSYNAKYGYLRDFGILHAGDKLTFSVAPKDDKTGTLTIYAGIFNDDAFDSLYQQLSKQKMSAATVTDTSFEGTITVEEEGICYFSIPYDSGWTATVNGKKYSTVAVFDAFIGLRLGAGTHTVSLRYETPGFQTGLTISYVCLAIFFVFVMFALLRKLLTRPMQQVDVEMVGKPTAKSSNKPQPAEWEPTFFEPIEEAPPSPASANATSDAPLSEATQLLPSVSPEDQAPQSEIPDDDEKQLPNETPTVESVEEAVEEPIEELVEAPVEASVEESAEAPVDIDDEA